MILKGFKEKSNKKYIDKCVKSRIITINASTIKTVGILVNDIEFNDLEWLNGLSKVLKINTNNLKIMSLTNTKKDEISVYTNTFTEKEIGWKGNFKSEDIKTFVSTEFDLLVNLYETNHLALQLVTAASKAKLKVGIASGEERLNDIIIQTKLKDHNIFKTELVKYLNILKKLNNE